MVFTMQRSDIFKLINHINIKVTFYTKSNFYITEFLCSVNKLLGLIFRWAPQRSCVNLSSEIKASTEPSTVGLGS